MHVEFKDEKEMYADDMKDGDIAVIIKWCSTDKIGFIVQRRTNNLIILNNLDEYTGYFSSKCSNRHNIVRKLLPGDKICI